MKEFPVSIPSGFGSTRQKLLRSSIFLLQEKKKTSIGKTSRAEQIMAISWTMLEGLGLNLAENTYFVTLNKLHVGELAWWSSG